MDPLTQGLLLAIASTGMVFFGIRLCMTILEMEAAIRDWAEKNRFRILQMLPCSRGQHVVYSVTLIDDQQKQRKARVSVGWCYLVGFIKDVQVLWED